MPSFHLALLLPLLAAHFLSDFAFQPDSLARRKSRPGGLLLHLGITGLCAYALLGDFAEWRLPLLLVATHGLIDLLKAWVSPRWIKELPAFVADQAAHLAVIFILSAIDWTRIGLVEPWWQGHNPAAYLQTLAFLAGAVATTQAAGHFIAKALPGMLQSDPRQLSPEDGLNRAGRYIGYLERLLLLLFVFTDQLAAAGFLIAAKSVFRFQKANEDRKQTEYILVGTLLSFTLGIAIAFAAKATLP